MSSTISLASSSGGDNVEKVQKEKVGSRVRIRALLGRFFNNSTDDYERTGNSNQQQSVNEISGPYNTVHRIHVGYDGQKFTGLPQSWLEMLQRDINEIDQKRNPTAVVAALKTYAQLFKQNDGDRFMITQKSVYADDDMIICRNSGRMISEAPTSSPCGFSNESHDNSKNPDSPTPDNFSNNKTNSDSSMASSDDAFIQLHINLESVQMIEGDLDSNVDDITDLYNKAGQNESPQISDDIYYPLSPPSAPPRKILTASPFNSSLTQISTETQLTSLPSTMQIPNVSYNCQTEDECKIPLLEPRVPPPLPPKPRHLKNSSSSPAGNGFIQVLNDNVCGGFDIENNSIEVATNLSSSKQSTKSDDNLPSKVVKLTESNFIEIIPPIGKSCSSSTNSLKKLNIDSPYSSPLHRAYLPSNATISETISNHKQNSRESNTSIKNDRIEIQSSSTLQHTDNDRCLVNNSM
jgi:hypothetical protein